ncbi:MAG: FtsX-like permease family protein [Gammaproteobacteria bacterium]|nr:FtsX-like permease family protein [Gammaproteobacteria bacterium]
MIPVTYRASFSYLLRHPWQLALALLGIGIGVAVIVAVDLANASARKAFLLSMDTVTGQATHQIIGGPSGVSEDVYTSLRVEHGIRAVAPVVEGTITIDKATVSVLGVDLFAEREIRAFTGEARDPDSGEPDFGALFAGFLVTPGAVTTSERTAEDLGLVVGDKFELLAEGKTRRAELLATFAGDGDDGSYRLLVTDIATAQDWLGRAGWLTRIDVRVADGDEEALAALKAALPAGTQLLSAAGRTRSTAEMSKAFMTNLTAMSLLALLVGLFLIFNSVNFSVLQRRGLIGVLRALGLTRRQLLAMILVEAGLLGLVAAVFGVALGIILGEQLLDLVARTINDLYFRVNVTTVSVDTFSIVKGLVAGIGAALVAAALPAVEATAYEPRLAMMRSALEQRAHRALPAVALAGLGLMFAAVVLILVSGTDLVAGLAAVFLIILGFALCVPLFVRYAADKATPAAAALGGTTARMAVAGIASGLSRTGIAIVALAVAVSATIGVSIMVDSFRGSVSQWLEQTLQADVYVGAQRGSMDPELIGSIRQLDGIAAVSTQKRAWVEDRIGRTQLRVFEMPPAAYAGTELLDADPATVWPLWESSDAVLVSEPYSYQFNVRSGDEITLPTDHGPAEFVVAATFQSYDINASGVMMSRATFSRHYNDDTIDSLGLYLVSGGSAERIVEQVGVLSRDRQELYIASNASLRQESMRIFDRTFVITDVLYWLTLGVAFIGILSAMLALQLERARESATLRALGMTPTQVGSIITAQTGVIGLLSGLAAVPLGIVMAWVLIKVINRRAFGWQIDMSIAPNILLVSVAFAIGAALLAGLYPAYRAGRSQPAIAMREE